MSIVNCEIMAMPIFGHGSLKNHWCSFFGMAALIHRSCYDLGAASQEVIQSHGTRRDMVWKVANHSIQNSSSS